MTQADRDSEAAIVGEIRRRYPHHQVLAEEGGGLGPQGSDYQWIVDPLDGTTNFVRGLPIYSVSIACRHGEQLVVGVVLEPQGENLFAAALGTGAYWNDRPMAVTRGQGLDGAFLATGFPFRAHGALDLYLQVFREVFLKARAIRRCGSAALDLAYTAAGIYDGFFEFRLAPWDVAAGAVLVREAGGRVTDLDGGQGFLEKGNLVAAPAGVHDELRELIGVRATEALLDRLAPVECAVLETN